MRNTIFSVSILAVWLLTLVSPAFAATTTLTFNAPIGGSINDVHGSGTGFTHRLPGTGSAIPANDPNMDLLASPGRLRLTSAQADFNQFPGPTGNNLSNLEAPGLYRSGVGLNDIYITALFEDVSVPNGSDQLELYAGVNENLILRAGVHETNVFIFTENTGIGDVNTFTGPGAFSTGDDLELTLSRQSGLWSLSWNNLTAVTSGSLPAAALPWLNAEPDLYFGIHAANPGTTTSFVGIVDYFTLTVVPEPSSLSISVFGAIVWLFVKGRSRERKR